LIIRLTSTALLGLRSSVPNRRKSTLLSKDAGGLCPCARLRPVALFRSKARRRLPGFIFHYIDGAAEDEVTYDHCCGNARQAASTYTSQIKKPMCTKSTFMPWPSSDGKMRLERQRERVKVGGFAMMRIREGIGSHGRRSRPPARRGLLTAWACHRRRQTRSGYYHYAFGPQRDLALWHRF
jgi:hypothetical protein